MNIVADLHTHTLFTPHAYSTLNEMVVSAKEKGLRAIAITDHGMAMPDSGHAWHFHNTVQIPKIINGVYVLFGVEANVIDKKGNIDMPAFILDKNDWIIASIHREIFEELTFEETTNIWINIAKNPYIDMIGHCEQLRHPFDIDLVIQEFAKNNKVVELNGNSINVRPTGIENMKTIAIACKKYGCKMALNSDAHSMYKVADIDSLLNMVQELELPEELIINSSFDNFVEHLKSRKRSFYNVIKENENV